jgi:hypothetical protein
VVDSAALEKWTLASETDQFVSIPPEGVSLRERVEIPAPLELAPYVAPPPLPAVTGPGGDGAEDTAPILQAAGSAQPAADDFPVEVSLSPFQLEDEWFAVGTVRDITRRKANEREIARLNQLYLALSHVNQAVVRAASRSSSPTR